MNCAITVVFTFSENSDQAYIIKKKVIAVIAAAAAAVVVVVVAAAAATTAAAAVVVVFNVKSNNATGFLILDFLSASDINICSN